VPHDYLADWISHVDLRQLEKALAIACFFWVRVVASVATPSWPSRTFFGKRSSNIERVPRGWWLYKRHRLAAIDSLLRTTTLA